MDGGEEELKRGAKCGKGLALTNGAILQLLNSFLKLLSPSLTTNVPFLRAWFGGSGRYGDWPAL
jgi:hypothetical protein